MLSRHIAGTHAADDFAEVLLNRVRLASIDNKPLVQHESVSVRVKDIHKEGWGKSFRKFVVVTEVVGHESRNLHGAGELMDATAIEFETLQVVGSVNFPGGARQDSRSVDVLK